MSFEKDLRNLLMKLRKDNLLDENLLIDRLNELESLRSIESKPSLEPIFAIFRIVDHYKELEKLCKEGYTFLIGRGMDMQFEKQMWNLSELSSYVKELCKKGKRVSIIALKSNQIITSENPLKVEGLCIEKYRYGWNLEKSK